MHIENYIERTMELDILKGSKHFPAILLTGPRQVGKTTLLKKLIHEAGSIVELDDTDARSFAQNDPRGFLGRYKLPILIDEVQYAPELFPYIKMAADRSEKPGQFWLTGSQPFSMMKNVSESMAGRVGVYELRGISLAEEEGRPTTPAFIPTPEVLEHRQEISRVIPPAEIYEKICRGSLPDIVRGTEVEPNRVYRSYTNTYVQRDVREYLKIDNQSAFQNLMGELALRTGQLLNCRSLSAHIGVSEPTVTSWIDAMVATGTIVLVPPYFSNRSKSVRKAPKVYFMDTGLCCHLIQLFDPELLENSPMAGPMLENYAVSEIIKSRLFNGSVFHGLYFYRDYNQREVDLLIDANGKLHPVEIKKNASISNTGFKGFGFLEKALDRPMGHGCVLCFSPALAPYDRNTDLVPIGYL